MLISRLLTAITALAVAIPSNARYLTEKRSIDTKRTPVLACATNSECLRKGLPLLKPQKRGRRMHAQRRAVIATDPTCGVAQTLDLEVGSYSVTLSGAAGGEGGYDRGTGAFGAPGGSGAVLNATIVTTSRTSLSYYIGCAGTHPRSGAPDIGSGGGGGMTTMYLNGAGQPAILVAGGGGGTGTYGTQTPTGTGRAAGTSTVDASPGIGGQLSNDYYGGGAGAGFSQSGQTRTSTYQGFPGSPSFNYGGNFAGGASSVAFQGITGGSGGGGGGGVEGGGGGGGYSGGSGSMGFAGGGGGGGSYANEGLAVRGIVVTVRSVTATNTRVGNLRIETV